MKLPSPRYHGPDTSKSTIQPDDFVFVENVHVDYAMMILGQSLRGEDISAHCSALLRRGFGRDFCPADEQKNRNKLIEHNIMTTVTMELWENEQAFGRI